MATKKKPSKLPPTRLTMLVAWHKFDNYERTILAQCVGMELNKLPFVLIEVVWAKLTLLVIQFRYAKYSNDKGGYYFPVVDYRKRIIRAVIKEQKKHKRVRLKIEV